MWQVITLSLLILSINGQSQTLVSNQTVSAGTNASFDRVRAVDYSDDGTKLLTVYGNIIKLWTQSGTTWVSNSNVTAPEALEDTRFNSDGSAIIGLANNSNTAYVFNIAGGNAYTLAQNITFGAKPISLGLTEGGNYSIFGGADGGIRIYTKNSNGIWVPYQIIPSAHTGSVSGLSARRSRFVTCGSGDNTVKVWYYNLTTGIFTLQETDTMGSTGCSAIHYSANQDRYAAGYTNGNIYIRDRNNTYNYTGSSTVSAGSQPVYNLRFSPDASRIASASADTFLYMFARNPSGAWVTNAANNYSTYSPYSLDFKDNNQLAVGSVNSTVGNTYTAQESATNCANDPNSNGTNDTINSCFCNTGYAYFGGFCQILNCAGVNNSVGTVNATTCSCATGFKWATNTSTCVRDCSADSKSLGYNYDDASCYCMSGYTWGGSSCIVYVNCVGLANSPGTNAQSGVCYCNSSYVYNSTLNKCVLDCSNVANSNGFNTTNTSQCNCSTGYWFNKSFGSNNASTCIRTCNVSGYIRGNDFTDPTKCRCYDSFSWVNSSNSCVLDCTRVNYSTSVVNTNGSCKCNKDYKWDKTIYKCISKLGSNQTAVAIACGVAIPLGVLGLLGLIGLLAYGCRRAPAPPVVTPVYMQPAPVVTTTTTEVIEKVAPPMVTSTSRIAGPPIVSERVVGHYSGPTYTSTIPNQVIPGGTMTRGFAGGPGGVISGSTAARGTVVGGPVYGGAPLVTSGMGVGGPLLPPPSGFPGRF